MTDVNKYLIREYFELCEGGKCQDFLTEEDKRRISEGTTILTGMVQHAGCKNGNGRIYERHILEREIEKYQALVQERRALGELDHPEDSVINLKNASHLITEMWWNGDKVMAKLEILDTPCGLILKALVRTVVEDDFQLICFDMVSEPSTPNAFMLREHLRKDFSKTQKLNSLLDDIIGYETE